MNTTAEILKGIELNPEFTIINSRADLEAFFAVTPGTNALDSAKAGEGKIYGKDYNGWGIALKMLREFKMTNRWMAGYEELANAQFSTDYNGTQGRIRTMVCTISRLDIIVGGAETIEITEYDGTTIINTHSIPTTPESIALDLANAIDEYSF